MRAPLPENEQERLDALRRYEVLDTDAEKTFDEITALAASVTRTPIALISLVDETRQWFKSRVGVSATETPRDIAFCSHAILTPDVMVVADALKDPRFADNPLVQSEPSIRFYAGAPLVTDGGFRLGTLCVIDRKPRQLSASDELLLRILSQQVVVQLELRRALRESRNAEAALRNIFSHMLDVHYRTDLGGTLLAISPSVQQYGYDPQELLGCDVAVLYAESAARDQVLQMLLEKGSLRDFELRLRRKDGGVLPFSVSAQLLRDERDQPSGTEGLLRDISNRKQAERQRADFMAMVTHDIRTPLSNILGYVELLPDDDEDSADEDSQELTEACAGIKRNAKMLQSLVKNYLDASRIEAGELVLGKHPLALNDLLVRVCDASRGEAIRSGVAVVPQLDPNLPVIEADALALERVFTNLVQNALKFTPRGGQVNIRSRQGTAGVSVEVADTGAGIAAQDLPLLFERYHQTESGRRRAGTGLGLFIVKSLVQAHGGTVEVSSTLGVGSTFTVTLPLRWVVADDRNPS